MRRVIGPAAVLVAVTLAAGWLGSGPAGADTRRQEERMIRGLRTVAYHVEDLQAAKEWYSRVLEQDPYFDEPFYVGFEVGGFELGLVPDSTDRGHGDVYAYWGVDDIEAALDRLLELGATEHEAIEDVGGGIRTAAVEDPFGNILGIIENPQFDPDAVR